jgi:hypothetical protein
LVAQFKNPGVHARSGAAVNPSERPSLDAEFGRIGDERTTKTAIDNVYNTMISKIRAAAVGKEDLVRDILTARGLGDVLPAQDPAAAAMPQPQPGAVDPLAGAQDFVPLGVPQRKPAALAPSAPGALGPPQAVNADDWKARYEKFKIGAPQ